MIHKATMKRAIVLLLFLSAMQGTGFASETPRIGLVLSGGGARGAAHIGVLKVLEELRIPIHAIAGTSMGALVGGAYASGIPASELEQRMLHIDWDKMLTDDPPRAMWPARRKHGDERPTWDFTLEKRDGKLGVGTGAIEGQNLQLFFTDLTRKSDNIERFDDLPIPFRAIATNLENGQMVVFEKGSLPAAMRASMSAPGVFSPLEKDGGLYVDGGLVRNLPIDVVREMGVDLVIAVNLGTSYLDRDQLKSIFGIASQMLVILTEQNVQISLKELKPGKDLLIVPDLKDISAGDFKRASEAIAAGETAAKQATAQLEQFSMDEQDYTAWYAGRFQRTSPPEQVEEVQIAGIERVNKKLFKPLEKKYQGKALDRDELENDLGILYGRGDFNQLGYHVRQDDDQNILVVDVIEKPWESGYFKFGLGFMSDNEGDARFSIRGTYTRPWINSLGGEWHSELSVGNESRFFTELYQPIRLDRAGFFVPYLDITETPLSVFLEDTRVARYDIQRRRAGLDIGTTLGLNTELRVGAYLGKTRFDRDTGDPLLPEDTDTDSGLIGSLFYDSRNSLVIPTSGSRIALLVRNPRSELGADNQYIRAVFNWQGAYSKDKNIFIGNLRYADSVGDDMPYYDQFPLGGFLKLSGYANEQFRGERMAYGNIVYSRQIATLPSLIGRGLYLGGSLEAGRLWDGPRASDGAPLLNPEETRYGGSLFFAADSFVGPFFVAWGLSGEGDNTIYVLLSQPWEM